MAQYDRNRIEQDCARVLITFYASLDARRNTEVASAFAEDGVWVRMGAPLNGVAAIQKAVAERFPDALIVHQLSNLYFTSVEEMKARSRVLVNVYAGKPGADGKPGEGALRAVTAAETDYVLTAGGWRIAHHSGTPVMMV